ncbi:MAG: 4-(cytidine 5'-diphospho)-2-C-methyl-D-erythritol kinase [Beutenbergiaceae bacterium]
MTASVHVRAPGKINIALRVGAREADGYHRLATVFQAVSLYEDVVARDGDDIQVSVTGRQADQVPTGPENLAYRAARLLAEATGTQRGVQLQIHKQVPTAGGMGGGSADAAATLLACDLLWQTGLAREELGELAAELGADVPFALTGQTAVGVGRGDVLTPALARGRYTWVLAISHRGLATPQVFSEWDQQNPGPVPEPTIDPRLMQALLSADPWRLAPLMVNELQPAAVAARPELDQVMGAFLRSPAIATTISGSGPTVIGLAADAVDANEIVSQLTAAAVADEVLMVHGPAPGARLVASVMGEAD